MGFSISICYDPSQILRLGINLVQQMNFFFSLPYVCFKKVLQRAAHVCAKTSKYHENIHVVLMGSILPSPLLVYSLHSKLIFW